MTSNRGQNVHLVVSSLQLVISSCRLFISSCRHVISSRRLVISSRLVACRPLNSCELIISSPELVVSSCRPFNLPSRRVNSSSRRGTSRHAFQIPRRLWHRKHKLHKLKYPRAILPPSTLTLRKFRCPCKHCNILPFCSWSGWVNPDRWSARN